jgi:undecaprenyl-diphosphatase
MRRGLPEWAQRRFDPTQRYGLRVTLYAIAMLLLAVPFSFLLMQVLSAGPVTEVDQGVAESIYNWIHEYRILIDASWVLSTLGIPPIFYATVGGAALWFYKKHHRRLALFMITTPLVGGIISSTVKILVDRERPVFDEPIAEAFGKSFPSGHAMTATVGYGTLLFAFLPFVPAKWKPRAIVGYVVLVLLIGASRLGLGVHYLSDVLGGFILGAAWLCVSIATFRVWRREQHKRTADIVEGAEPEIAQAS